MNIRPLAKSDIKFITNIANYCFGSNYITKKELHNRIESSNFDFVFESDDKVKGFILTSEINSNLYNSFDIELSSESAKCTIIKTIAIDKNYQNKGLGSGLIKHVINFYQKLGFTSILYPAWLENEQSYFLRKMESFGFVSLKVFSNYWKEDSLLQEFSCKRCGTPPCTCTMQLYELNIKD